MKKVSGKIILWALTAGFIFWMPLSWCSAKTDLQVEGILYDDGAPYSSMVVVNGQSLRVGDVIEGYEVAGIRRQTVGLKNSQTGELTWYEVTVARKETNAKPSKVSAQPDESLMVPPDFLNKGNAQIWFEKLKLFWDTWRPAALLRRAYELKAMLDLTKIYNGAVSYTNAGGSVPWEIKHVVEAGYLPESFLQPVRGRYVLYLNPRGEDFGVHADPVEEGTGMRAFFMGRDGVIRGAFAKSADAQSLPQDYGF